MFGAVASTNEPAKLNVQVQGSASNVPVKPGRKGLLRRLEKNPNL